MNENSVLGAYSISGNSKTYKTENNKGHRKNSVSLVQTQHNIPVP